MDLTPPTSKTAPAPTPATAVPNPADGRSTTFQPVTGASEMQSGEKLLVEAYAAIWIILFVMVLLSWRRQRQLEARIDHLEGAIAKAREASEGKGGA